MSNFLSSRAKVVSAEVGQGQGHGQGHREKEIIQITALSSEGEGVGSLNGLKVFVDGALPDEKVSVKIVEKKKNYAKAELLSVITPAAERVIAPCPLFRSCGGCQVMHVEYSAQLRLKHKRVRDALDRIGGLKDIEVLPCLPSPLPLAYRNKIQLPIIWDQGKKQIGLYRKKSHDIIPISKCLIQCSQGEEILALVQEHLAHPAVRYVLIRNAVFNDEALVIFVTAGNFSKELKPCAEALMERNSSIKGVVENQNRRLSNTILSPQFHLVAGRPFIYENLLGKTFKISPSAFFQVNPGQTERLYETAIRLADIQTGETVLDAYCGVGALAIFAAEKAQSAYGIECIPQAIADAKENAHLNHLSNCVFTCGHAETLIHKLDFFDTVFLNPPRKGCAPKMLTALLQKKPAKIVYISCDPATLARDLAYLSPQYQLGTIQPFDMFPQTMHVETVVRLTKK